MQNQVIRFSRLFVLFLATIGLSQRAKADARNPQLPSWITTEQFETMARNVERERYSPSLHQFVHETAHFDRVELKEIRSNAVTRFLNGGTSTIEFVAWSGGRREDLQCAFVPSHDGSEFRVHECRFWRAQPEPGNPGRGAWYGNNFLNYDFMIQRSQLTPAIANEVAPESVSAESHHE